MEIVALFCEIDDFCQQVVPPWQHRLLVSGDRQRLQESRLCVSEGMTMVISSHQSGYRTFKDYFCVMLLPTCGGPFPSW
jgi:hypothetical protein